MCYVFWLTRSLATDKVELGPSWARALESGTSTSGISSPNRLLYALVNTARSSRGVVLQFMIPPLKGYAWRHFDTVFIETGDKWTASQLFVPSVHVAFRLAYWAAPIHFYTTMLGVHFINVIVLPFWCIYLNTGWAVASNPVSYSNEL